MPDDLKLMAVLAHPDDESLGLGGTLAKYAAEGVETYLVCATRGERGRFGNAQVRPAPEEVGRVREAELRAAARELAVKEVHFLNYIDKDLDQADPDQAIGRIVAHIRRVKPQIVVTFSPDGGYGHPDHIAISQFAAAATVAAADPDYANQADQSAIHNPKSAIAHRVSKLYYMTWTPDKWAGYQEAFRDLKVTVDDVDRRANPWPDWSITTKIDTTAYWEHVWRAVNCHKTQMALFEKLGQLTDEHHKGLWGSQEFYRVFSLVNGGRKLETDLFEGLREGADSPLTTMPTPDLTRNLRKRRAPLDLPPDQFRALGHRVVDQIADFMASLPSRKVTPCEPVQSVRDLIDFNRPLPERGTEPGAVLAWIAEQLFDHSLHNGHPRFWGYVTSSAAPIGALGDFLAASVNPNAGGWKLSPLATEIEVQTIRWIAELIGYPTDCGGLLVSGGNMANFVGFLVGRRAKCGWDVREAGMPAGAKQLRVYTSQETHTWIQKAADLFGLGTNSVVWVPVDGDRRMDTARLRTLIENDRRAGLQPLMVVGTAGSVGSGAVDPLGELAVICAEQDLWFHVDGAYGAFAAALPDASPDLRALNRPDSVAMDPHKWLYAPLEAGCVLLRQRQLLLDTFSYHPPYYHFDPELTNYFDLGPQNSRGFRALKVWLALQQVGREGYIRMISDDIQLAGELYRILPQYPELERLTHGLSIVTFRYIPPELRSRCGDPEVDESLDDLNREILDRLEASGEAFLSNAILNGRFALRLCIVNFRTSLEDIEALPPLVIRLGQEADQQRKASGG